MTTIIQELGLTEEDLRELYPAMWHGAEYSTQNNYLPIFKRMQELGLSQVYDIGCNYGPYIGLFVDNGIKYTGIDKFEIDRHKTFDEEVFFDADFIHAKYPFSIETNKDISAAISVCCIGSRDMIEPEVVKSQMNQLSHDFKHFFCSTFADSLFLFIPFWQHHEIIKTEQFGNSFQAAIVHYWND